MEIKEIMTRQEAAEYLGVSLSHFSTFQNQIKQLRLGANVRFRKIDIDEFVEQNMQKRCKYCGCKITDGNYCCESCYNQCQLPTT